jgi:hypothetical protein
MESMLYQGHRFFSGIKRFWMAMRLWKTNLVLEDLAVSLCIDRLVIRP